MHWVAQLAVACLFVAPQNASDSELLFFTAPQCIYCEQVKPVVAELQARGYPIRTIDFATQPDVVRQFQVTQFPTFVLMHQGRAIDGATGAISGERMIAMLEAAQALSPPAAYTESPSASDELAAPPRTAPNIAYTRSQLDQAAGPNEYEPYQVGLVSQLNAAQQRALESSVRIEVYEANSLATGSGTLIDQRPFDANSYDALVLTCGHLFREAGPQSQVTVEIGFPNQTQKYPAMVLSFDSERHDIALLAVRVDRPVVVAPLARPDYPASEGDEVFSVGCSHGEDPTVFKTRIKALTHYTSAVKYDTFGRPAQGRSGGGLFTAGGQLIGVCNASAVNVDEGIFAGKEGIVAILRENNLEDLMANPEFLAQRDTRATPTPSPFVQPISSRATDLQSRGESQPSVAAAAASPAMYPVDGMNPVSAVSAPREITVVIPDPDHPGQTKVLVIRDPDPELLRQLQEQAAASQASRFASAPPSVPSGNNGSTLAPPPTWQTVPQTGSLMRGQSPR